MAAAGWFVGCKGPDLLGGVVVLVPFLLSKKAGNLRLFFALPVRFVNSASIPALRCILDCLRNTLAVR